MPTVSSSSSVWKHLWLPAVAAEPRLFRKCADGTYRSIACVPGGPPTPMGWLQPGETLIIDTPTGQVETVFDLDGDVLVRVLPDRPHRV